MLMAGLFACNTPKELTTVDNVNIQKYSGLWYEIARLPNSFEKGMECVTAIYTLKENEKIHVLNKGYTINGNGKYSTAKGKAWMPDNNYPGRLKVSFFWPFAGNYYIIKLDDNYQHALVGDPSRKYLWILSRTKQMDEKIIDELMSIAEESGFQTKNVIMVNQDCNY